jgi:hypothetical protein
MKLFVPNQMNEIKLVDYQKFIRLEGDDEFLSRKAVEIFCGLSMDVILQMKASSLQKTAAVLSKAFTEKPPLTNRFTIGKQEFGFIPSLDEITVGELNDLDEYISDWQQLHKALAVLYRPVTARLANRYDIEEYQGTAKYAEVMKSAPLNVAIGAMVFFWTLGKDLSLASLKSLAKENQMNLAPLHNLLKNGDGFLSTTNSLAVMLLSLKPSPNSPQHSPSPTSPLKKTASKQRARFSKNN